MTASLHPYVRNSWDTRHPSLNGLGADPFAVVGSGATIAASAIAPGTAGASALIAAGVSAQAIPVIGTILGATAILAGIIATNRAKAKAIKSNINDVNASITEARSQLVYLDTVVAQAQNSRNNILSDMQRLGISVNGLAGFSDWVKQTFTPGKYYGAQLDNAQDELNSLLAQIEQRNKFLENILAELEGLYNKLTGSQKARKILVISGITVATVALGFLLKKLLN